MKNYTKAAVQAAGAILSFILAATLPFSPGGDAITLIEWSQIATLSLGVIPVGFIPNTGHQRYARLIISGSIGAVSLLPALLTDGLAANELIQLALAFGTAAGVWAVPDRTDEHFTPTPRLF